MISKERLQYLIKKGETIYEVKYNNINSVSLTNKIRGIYYKNGVIDFEPRPDEKYLHHKYFKNLFETKEEAEWYREFGCIERIERLWFPTWESVYNDLKDYKDGDFYILDNDCFSFVYNKRYETSQLFLYTHNEKYNWNANKENYYEACKLAKSLFLGEKK